MAIAAAGSLIAVAQLGLEAEKCRVVDTSHIVLPKAMPYIRWRPIVRAKILLAVAVVGRRVRWGS